MGSRELCVCAVHTGCDVIDVQCHDVTLTYIRPDYLCSSSFSRNAVGSNTFPVLPSRSVATEYQFLIPHYLQILFDLISTSSSWSSSFSHSFHSTGFFFFCILSLHIFPLCPYHPNSTALAHFTLCAPHNVSCMSLFVLIVVKCYCFLWDCTFLLQSACRIGLL